MKKIIMDGVVVGTHISYSVRVHSDGNVRMIGVCAFVFNSATFHYYCFVSNNFRFYIRFYFVFAAFRMCAAACSLFLSKTLFMPPR